jgi:exopolysaccharide biosynthesis polyprenyl glycosylphosphotransferase
MSSDATRYSDLQTAIAPGTNGDAVSAMASATVADGALQTPLAATASGSEEPMPDVTIMPAAAAAAAAALLPRRGRRLALSMRGLLPMVAGGLAVTVATVIAVLSSPDDSATVIPVTTLALAVWCTVLQYLHSGGVQSPLALGTPVISAVAGATSLAGASAAVMLLPAMNVVHRTEVLIMAAGVAIGAGLYEVTQRRFGRRPKVLVVGAGNGGAELVEELRAGGDIPFSCIGLLADDAAPGTTVGGIHDLGAVVEQMRPDLLVLAGVEDRALATQLIFEASKFPFRLVELNHFYEEAFGRLPLNNLTPAWFMGLLHLHRRPYSRISKRTFDLAITAVAIVPVALLFPLVALLVRCSGPGAILFKQVRLGECGKLFKIYKFRTMVVDAERQGVAVWASAADPRITPIGRFMRRTRLDELPQLWNVLRGDMSIVGPRPERPEFLELLAKEVPFWERRHLVKPGITGWAQVRCGYTDDSLGAADKLSHDLYYLKHRSLLLDVAIAAKTAAIVVRGTGAH